MDSATAAQHKTLILIVGLGRLGSRAASLLNHSLAQEHVELVLCDYDIVMQDNLEQQPLYDTEDIGTLKVDAARRRLLHAHPECSITTIPRQFNEDDTQGISIILDGTDNLATRTQLNRAALRHKIPLIIAAASEKTGMVFPVTIAADAPCWECIVAGKTSSGDCESGIDNTLADTIANKQAELCLKILQQEPVTPELSTIHNGSIQKIVVRKNSSCVCAQKIERTMQDTEPFTLEPCVSGRRLIARMTRTKSVDFESIKKNYLIQQEYTNALLVDLKIGTALVHKHGAIEFIGIPEDIARKFSQDILR